MPAGRAGDSSAGRAEAALDGAGDIVRQAFLQLRAVRGNGHGLDEVREACDAAVLRLIDDVNRAEERHEMMLAHREERDALHGDKPRAPGLEWLAERFGSIPPEAVKEVCIHLRDAHRRLFHPRGIRLHAERREKFAHGMFCAHGIDCHRNHLLPDSLRIF